MINLAAYLSVFLISITILFQFALAAGLPWGALAMGGRYPGRFPPAMRIVAIIQATILAAMGFIILVRAGSICPDWLSISEKIIWGVVVFNAAGLIANLATPSQWERIIWAPIIALLLICSLVIALD